MSRKLSPSTLAIIAALKANPKAKPKDLAAEHSVPVGYVYKLRKQMAEGRRKITLTRDQVEIAKKLGVSLEDYVKEGLKMGALKYDGERPIVNPEITMEPEETNVDQILGERGNRYGTFESNAKTCQLLKNVLHSQEGWYRLSYVQREAVEMMMHKISRLVNGDATYLDTVVDIAGYNQLMLEHMRDRNEGKKVE
jgi:hypothetical protein